MLLNLYQEVQGVKVVFFFLLLKGEATWGGHVNGLVSRMNIDVIARRPRL